MSPAPIDYGPAGPALRCLLAEWRAITWFVPPAADDPARACELFHAYNTLAHAAMPDTFAAQVAVRVERGGWPEFAARWHEVSAYPPVRQPSWDWIFSGLKPLSLAHARRRGFELHRHPACVDLSGEGFQQTMMHRYRPADERTAADPLFFRWSADTAVWDVPASGFNAADEGTRAGGYYASWTTGNLTYALEWQLAEASADLTGNPFVPILRLYAARFYPFVLARDEAVLFAFS